MPPADATSRHPDRASRPTDTTGAVVAVACHAARSLLDLHPVLAGDAAQVTVDAFVEQAAAALEALATRLAR